jgi:hypothetical protein
MTDKITAKRVPVRSRMNMLPKHFGIKHMVRVENAIYDFLRALSEDYSGGFWQFYELSNGGFYMAPDESYHPKVGRARAQVKKLRVRVAGNGYEGEMSADAAGIVACLFAFSHLSFRLESEAIGEHYQRLREFALDHPEASAIMSAID